MKKSYVADLREGARVEDVFLVVSKTIGSTRSGSLFLKLKLGDKTGTLDCVKWDVSEAEVAKVCENDYVLAHGLVKTYNGDLQVALDSVHKHSQDIDPSDFLASTALDPDDMLRELMELLQSVANPRLRQLLDCFFADDEFVGIFRECPAAQSVHHAYIGGLLEHTLNVVKTCAALAELYPDADRDLLLTSAALHDIGKVDEFDWSGSIRYSDFGCFVGHVVGGTMMVKDAAASISGFDPLMSLALQHAILAHHGSKEYGSPKLPKSVESMILHMADDLDAKVAIFTQAIAESDRSGDEGLFTKKHHLLARPIFKGIPSNGDDTPARAGQEEEGFEPDLFSVEFDPFADN